MEKMKQNSSFRKIWLVLLSSTSIAIAVIGFVMLIQDQNYFSGVKLIFTSIVFTFAVVLIIKNKIKPNYLNPMIGLGFVFTIIGLASTLLVSLSIYLWIFGIGIFVFGLLGKKTAE
jgi:hypothetical protein